MNIETRAVYDALAAKQSKTLRVASNFDNNKDQLVTDLKLVVADAEKLIREVASASNESFAALHARFDAKMLDAKERLGRVRTDLGEQAQQATAVARTYVKENPWRSAAVLVGVAVLLGFLVARQTAGLRTAPLE